MRRDELEVELGRRLRVLRVGRRLTQEDLADSANVSVGALKHLEQGVGASTATLAKVLRALGREDWVDQLAPHPPTFNPLDLLGREKRSARQHAETSRVRKPRGEVARRR
ncbi:MAG: helix-turn-helix domain-containing protein [Streptosporangiaceae bacterium]